MVLQIWLLVLLFYMIRASAVMRFSIATGCAGLTAAALPARLWKPQLRRLGLFALFIFASAAISAGAATSFSHLLEKLKLQTRVCFATSASQADVATNLRS